MESRHNRPTRAPGDHCAVFVQCSPAYRCSCRAKRVAQPGGEGPTRAKQSSPAPPRRARGSAPPAAPPHSTPRHRGEFTLGRQSGAVAFCSLPPLTSRQAERRAEQLMFSSAPLLYHLPHHVGRRAVRETGEIMRGGR